METERRAQYETFEPHPDKVAKLERDHPVWHKPQPTPIALALFSLARRLYERADRIKSVEASCIGRDVERLAELSVKTGVEITDDNVAEALASLHTATKFMERA